MSLKRLVRRHGTQAEWDSDDPVVWEGEVAWATDTGVFKVGDGVSTWSELSGIGQGGGSFSGPIDGGEIT